MGGVESLIRHLHKISKINEFYEFYEHCEHEEHFSTSRDIKFFKYGCDKNNLFSKIKTKLALYNMLLSFCKKTKVDCIIIFHPNDLLYIPLSIVKSSKIILVQTNRLDVFIPKFSSLIIKLRMKFLFKFTVYTEADKESLSKIFPAISDKIVVIPRGCRLNTANEVNQYNLNVVTICRIDNKQKNFIAMNDIVEKLPSGYSLDIYGDGSTEEKKFLTNLIKDNPKVRYLGPVTDVKSILREYSVFIMTSFYEGFGQSLIEARSQGLPIVAFNTFEALSWIVKDNFNGFIIKPYDHNLFASKIVELTRNEHVYKSYSLNALSLSESTDENKVMSLWESILK